MSRINERVTEEPEKKYNLICEEEQKYFYPNIFGKYFSFS